MTVADKKCSTSGQLVQLNHLGANLTPQHFLHDRPGENTAFFCHTKQVFFQIDIDLDFDNDTFFSSRHDSRTHVEDVEALYFDPQGL